MNYEFVIVELRERIGSLILNRPESLNAINLQMAEEIAGALQHLEGNDEVHVIIIKGAGPSFCAGVDIKEFSNKNSLEYRTQFSSLDRIVKAIPSMAKPVIAQVHGIAAAFGCGLVAACDLAVASTEARFGTTAINVGLYCFGPSAPLIRNVGRKKSLEMLLTGDLIDAQEAYRLGLVNKLVSQKELETTTNQLAMKLSSKSPLAVRMGKQSFYTMSDLEYNKALEYLAEITVSLAISEDYKEGVKAFTEKREPKWKGR